MELKSINPANGREFASYPEMSPERVAVHIDRCQRAFADWSSRGPASRGRCLARAAQLLESAKNELARQITLEMGKPLAQARAEVEKCALVCDFYARQGEALLQPESIPSDARRSYVRFDPLGVILAVMPWNFPFWQVFRFAAPALMAGNVCLLKHAANVPGCAVAIDDIMKRAGVGDDVFRTLLIGSNRVEEIIAHPAVKAVTLTGSDKAGSRVARIAGRYLKKAVLELGGSDPFIVLADADLGKCIAAAVTARMINNGQSCIAAKRFIVHKEIASRFRDRFTTAVSLLKVGDPLDEANDLGPLAREDLLGELERQVRLSLRKGARLMCGGRRLDQGGGFYYQPTVLADVKPGMPAYDQELFGPVAAVIEAEDETDAIRIANDTPFGLGASLWSADAARVEKLAAVIESGLVFVNGMVKSDPRFPFGGVKRSGYGRELSHYGIKEFVNIKTVWVG